jgi:predicted aminopeptidase
VFNESFANFVGARGAAWFFRARGSAGAADEVEARWGDQKALARFWGRLHASLDSAFRANPRSRRLRLAARDSIYGAARHTLVDSIGPRLHTIGPRTLERLPLDNAALLARRIYLTDLDLFDEVYAREKGNLKATIARVVSLAESNPKHPFEALRAWLGS